MRRLIFAASHRIAKQSGAPRSISYANSLIDTDHYIVISIIFVSPDAVSARYGGPAKCRRPGKLYYIEWTKEQNFKPLDCTITVLGNSSLKQPAYAQMYTPESVTPGIVYLTGRPFAILYWRSFCSWDS